MYIKTQNDVFITHEFAYCVSTIVQKYKGYLYSLRNRNEARQRLTFNLITFSAYLLSGGYWVDVYETPFPRHTLRYLINYGYNALGWYDGFQQFQLIKNFVYQSIIVESGLFQVGNMSPRSLPSIDKSYLLIIYWN